MAAKKLFKKSEEQLGNSIKHIISTKALSANSIHKLQQAGCNVDSYDIMSIEYRNDSLLKAKIEEINAPFVFTSKHGIYAAERFGLKAQKCYAISPVTSGIAQEAGFLLMTKAKNAKDLALAISHNDEKEIIHLTCPDRRKEMKNSLEEKNIKVHEYDVYFKTPKPKTHTNFDAILVFAPSHIRAFTSMNTIENQVIYCIGKTTAEFAHSLGYTHVKYCEISSEFNLVELALQDMTNE